jgi:S1-C subfamily serine protease
MKSFLGLLFFFICSHIGNSQSLTSERVAKIKRATVRITIANDNSMGTGFFVDENGYILTCWHVISPSIIINNNQIVGVKQIYAELNDGSIIKVAIPMIFFGDPNLNKNAIGNDFCLLVPMDKILRRTDYLKVGEFDEVKEGDEVYTCGYPIGIRQQFISKGIVSTKYPETSIVTYNGLRNAIPRSVALLDLTLNKGNSGGAIVKIGKTIDDDEVVGIADFIVTPMGGIADSLINSFDSSEKYFSVTMGGVDPVKTFSLMTKLISSLSIGVSGCISLDYYLRSLGHKKE